MALNPISEDLDPLLWAKRPRSQCALSLLRTGAAEGSGELATILSSHVRDGVCDESGKLLMRWGGLRWVSLAADRAVCGLIHCPPIRWLASENGGMRQADT